MLCATRTVQEAAINTYRQENKAVDPVRSEAEVEYQFDPHELKREGMQDSEPEPELIEGLPAPDALTPADRYLELFEDVQMARIFPDSKTFPDCSPKYDPLDVLIHYRRQRKNSGFDLKRFVHDHFYLPGVNESFYVSNPVKSLNEHIDEDRKRVGEGQCVVLGGCRII